ncbi:MAG: DevR family CRISPR-associated autoregulator [Acidobacteria bacterium]|nr:DevR family CRISPR-associated autoregulator [Acidobacteriota bacterium]
MIQTLSLCAELVLDLHNLNSEGTEGNQQQTRMVHIVDKNGKRHIVNAISGDMFKHIYVEHLTPLLDGAGQPLSTGARAFSPDRVTVDSGFREKVRGNRDGSAVQDEMLRHCAVTDIAGALLTEGNAVPRKSCAEFGWVVGRPKATVSEQYFHVKYAPESRAKSAGQDEKGEGTVAGRQAIFHRPANSGVYALVCHLELYRVGVNDINRKAAVDEESRRARRLCALRALIATLVKPAGAQWNTQHPHILDCRGVVSASSGHLPAPTVSPLAENYADEIVRVAATLNKIAPDSVSVHRFEGLGAGISALESLTAEV